MLLLFSSLSPPVVMAYPHNVEQSHVQGQRIPGHAVPLLNKLTPIGPTPKALPLHLNVALKLRNEAGLDALLAAQNDPSLPQYHHYLTSQEFTSHFAPTQATVDTVVVYLRQQGLHINAIAPNHVLIDVSTNVATAEHAFVINLHNYQLQTRVVYAPDADPLLPDTLQSSVQTISGLNNVVFYHPTSIQQKLKQLHTHAGPGGGYTPAELRSAYDVNPLLNARMNGSGQTVALFELDGYDPADIATYRQQYQLGPLNVSNVLVDGASNTPDANAIETTLDMENISAMAPEAAQKVYIGPNNASGINDTYNRIVTDNVAKIVSVSWGECELGSSSSRLDTLNTIFKQGAAQGQTFFAASGDMGAYDCIDNGIQNLAVDSIASNPAVVSVGGTTLYTGPKGTYDHETAWGTTVSGGILHPAGGGGGKSAHFLRPTFQSGTNLSDQQRLVPDVSANADPASGYSIYLTAGKPKKSGWQVVGGTSAAAPLWAGIAADLNQALLAAHAAPLGHALPDLYRLYNTPQVYPPYHDIVTGSNLYYQAGPDYDLATGMGTPDAWNILRDLQNAPSLPTQLLRNGGFEDGQAPWQEHSGGGFKIINNANPHTGKYAAYLCSYVNCHDRITQLTAIPAFTRKVTLSYWVYISQGDVSTGCQSNFQVFLRTAKGEPISQVQKLCNTDANGWMQYTFDVTSTLEKYVGQTVQLAFEATGTSSPRSNFFADVDDVNLTSLAVAPGITAQVIQNPSFEAGRAPWQESSKGGYELITTVIPHTGQSSAYLCGYPNCHDDIAQTVTLPTSMNNVVLSYWIYVGRADSTITCADTFHSALKLRTSQGATIADIQTLCDTSAPGWTLYSFDLTSALTPFAGKPIQIDFEAIGSSTSRANFFVVLDDMTLYVTHG
ncbi:protease pro-enzyme activation domain-containing protein [Dictyobacter alpinus]|nr:protease pro-enzyme activation domain-containing protein [Dictyobacter alpinus]